jgi:hypothetical protein
LGGFLLGEPTALNHEFGDLYVEEEGHQMSEFVKGKQKMGDYRRISKADQVCFFNE